MKIYISADIEGITGLVSWAQCGRPDGHHWDFPFARRMMTHDVNAAIRGARAAGASEIVVKDSHGNSKNLLLDELEDGVELVSGHGSATDGMMQGIDSTFSAAVLVGYHAMAGTLHGVMEHTITGGIHRLRINGSPAGEIALAVGVAGRYGVPVVAVSSDLAGCAEAKSLIPHVETAVVKTGLGRYMSQLKHPSETKPLIESAVKAGLSRRAEAKPWIPSEPIAMAMEFNRAEEADYCAKLIGVRRIDAYTVETEYPDFDSAHRSVWNLVGMSFSGLTTGN